MKEWRNGNSFGSCLAECFAAFQDCGQNASTPHSCGVWRWWQRSGVPQDQGVVKVTHLMCNLVHRRSSLPPAIIALRKPLPCLSHINTLLVGYALDGLITSTHMVLGSRKNIIVSYYIQIEENIGGKKQHVTFLGGYSGSASSIDCWVFGLGASLRALPFKSNGPAGSITKRVFGQTNACENNLKRKWLFRRSSAKTMKTTPRINPQIHFRTRMFPFRHIFESWNNVCLIAHCDPVLWLEFSSGTFRNSQGIKTENKNYVMSVYFVCVSVYMFFL